MLKAAISSAQLKGIWIMNIYEAIRSCGSSRENITATVTEGSLAGSKALISGGRIIMSTDDGSFFSAHAGEICSVRENCLRSIGGAQVFFEVIGHEKKLIICGGGHVSMPVIRIGKMLGFTVTVIEDRPEFAQNAENAGADRVICDSFASGLSAVGGGEDSYFVVVTRGHRWDRECLESIFGKERAYIGMMGSRRRVSLLKEELLASGISAEDVSSLRSPIGLSIAAETPEEIAVSIMAEIIEVKNRSGISVVYTKELLAAILNDDGQKKVLATIISRKGSAPRSVGTKMLILEGGKCIGTVGGGCAEMYIITHAGIMLEAGETVPKIIHVDMTASAAADEGMVCGGRIDVLLEPISFL